MSHPRVSILIPNYNNGRESSKEGDFDFLDRLMRSLVDTLRGDPTPVEILIHDDGSTDDSLETARRWTGRTWRGGEPVCRLIEAEHTGVLSKVANNLTREARGEFCVRLDGDIECLTPNWASELCRTFDEGPPDLGVVGPKQLGVEGRIHSAGDWILHPRGNHHVAAGAPREAVTRSIEVDHVMGCFYCHRRGIWEDVGGYDESILRGQTVDFSLQARLGGWRIWSTPTIEFTHFHALRRARSTRADTRDGIEATLNRFEEKWGFNRLVPDLDEVRRRYAGTNLLWNARVFGPSAAWPRPAPEPVEITATEWARFANDDAYRASFDRRLRVLGEMHRALPPRRRVLHYFCRAGLLCHMLAKNGVECVGVDPDPALVRLAGDVAQRETYPGTSPEHHVMPDASTIPLPDASVDTVLLFDVVERHPNPARLFHEAHRVLERGGVLAVVTPKRPGPFDLDADGLHCYRRSELKLQLQSTWKFGEFDQVKDDRADDLIVLLALSAGAGASEDADQPEALAAGVS